MQWQVSAGAGHTMEVGNFGKCSCSMRILKKTEEINIKFKKQKRKKDRGEIIWGLFGYQK